MRRTLKVGKSQVLSLSQRVSSGPSLGRRRKTECLPLGSSLTNTAACFRWFPIRASSFADPHTERSLRAVPQLSDCRCQRILSQPDEIQSTRLAQPKRHQRLTRRQSEQSPRIESMRASSKSSHGLLRSHFGRASFTAFVCARSSKYQPPNEKRSFKFGSFIFGSREYLNHK